MHYKFSLTLLCFVLITNIRLYAQTDKITPEIQLVQEGIALHDNQDYKGAIEKYEAALAIDPKFGNAMYELANSYLALGDNEQAFKWAEKTVKNNKGGICEAYTLMGNIYDVDKKTDKAIKTYKKGLDKCPDENMLHFNLGIAYTSQKDYDNAIKSMEQSVLLRSSHRSSHYYLGILEAENGQKTKVLLPLYYFLLLENDTKRSKNSIALIQEQYTYAKSDASGNMQLNLNAELLKGDFNGADMVLSLYPATWAMTKKALKDSLGVDLKECLGDDVFHLNESLFKTIETPKKGAKDKPTVWMDFYVPFFKAMHEAGHTEAMSYFIVKSMADAPTQKWLDEHQKELDEFIDWANAYLKNK
jgi:tetratricopeptide (TPR) repeat protein